VELLNTAKITGGGLDTDTARWLASLDDVLSDKLAAVGLIDKRNSATLGAFTAEYVAKRTDVKPATIKNLNQSRDDLLEFFGADKVLRDVKPGNADEFSLFLNEKYALNTARRRLGRASQFFRAAVRLGLIDGNPFDGLKTSGVANGDRFYFITREEADKVLSACPDAEWRLIFALSRYGALRCPSEHVLLTWGDVDWNRGRITIHSPKTEHHPGGESRIIPLFPELLEPLQDCWELAEPGTVHVLTRYRDGGVNLRTQLLRIIKRAGLQPWPKAFQNLRSTRETELCETFPQHVVVKWCGNSQPVAAKHYLQVTDEHYEKALQNPVQQAHGIPGKGSHASTRGSQKPLVCERLPQVATAEGLTECPREDSNLHGDYPH